MLNRLKLVAVCVVLLQAAQCKAQDKHMDFETYNPVSTLVVPQHPVHKAKFPFIDVHNHQWDVPDQNIPQLYSDMDSLDMMVMVNLSGRGYKQTNARNGDFDLNDHTYLLRSIENVKKTGSSRLIFFTNISFVGFGEPGWQKKLCVTWKVM
jgi:hypothetical protein